MMFAKAKRFDENKQCGPPPGLYNPKMDDTVVKGPTSFNKAGRFNKDGVMMQRSDSAKENCDDRGCPVQTPVATTRRSVFRASSVPRTPHGTPLKNSSSLSDLVNVNTEKEEAKRLLAEQKKLMDQLKAKDEELREVKAELEEISRQAAEGRMAREALTTDMELLRSTISIFEQQKDELATNMEASVVHTDAMEAENGQLHDMLASLRQEIDTLAGERNKLASDYQECQRDLDAARNHDEDFLAMQEHVKYLEDEEARLSRQCITLSHELDDVTRQLRDGLQHSATLAAQNSLTEMRVRSLEEALAHTQARAQDAEASLQTEVDAGKRLQQTVKSLDLQVGTSEDTHRRTIADYSSRLLDAEATILQHQLDMKAVVENASRVQVRLAAESDKLRALEERMASECASHLAYRADVDGTLRERRQMIRELEEQLEEETGRGEALRSELSSRESDLTDAQQQLDESQESYINLNTEYDACRAEIDQLIADKVMLRQTIQQATETNRQQLCSLGVQLTDANEEICRLQSRLEDSQAIEERVEAKWERHMADVGERSQRLNQELSRRLIDAEKRLAHTAMEHQSVRLQLQERLSSVEVQLHTALDEQERNGDAEKWREAYETLREQCAPFSTQLEMFAAERQLLESQSTLAKTEMEDLNRRYGELLGHHNQKQKIKHIMKIKEENLSMKQELMRLREQCDRQKRVIRQYEEKPRSAVAVAPSRKALAAWKENELPLPAS